MRRHVVSLPPITWMQPLGFLEDALLAARVRRMRRIVARERAEARERRDHVRAPERLPRRARGSPRTGATRCPPRRSPGSAGVAPVIAIGRARRACVRRTACRKNTRPSDLAVSVSACDSRTCGSTMWVPLVSRARSSFACATLPRNRSENGPTVARTARALDDDRSAALRPHRRGEQSGRTAAEVRDFGSRQDDGAAIAGRARDRGDEPRVERLEVEVAAGAAQSAGLDRGLGAQDVVGPEPLAAHPGVRPRERVVEEEPGAQLERTDPRASRAPARGRGAATRGSARGAAGPRARAAPA